MTRQKAVIIGAGYGGLALANLLAKKGYETHVYEKNESAGGRIHAVKKDGYVFDLGPSWYLMPEVFRHYYELFDMDVDKALELTRFSPGYKVFYENAPSVSVSGDLTKDRELFETIEAGAGKRLEQYVRQSSMVYALALRHFLYTSFRSPIALLRWDILRHAPRMMRLLFRSLDQHVSTYFQDRRLKQLLEYHSVFLGASPFNAPAIYSLMSHLDFQSGVYYPRRGMLQLPKDMEVIGRKLGITYHYNEPVAKIVVEDGKASGIETEQGVVVSADIVVSNADLHFTETKLLATQYQTYPQQYWDKREPGPGALLISYGIKRPLPTLQHHNLYFVDDWYGNFDAIYNTKTTPEHASIYICNPTKTDPALAPDGKENLFVLLPLPSGMKLDEKSVEELSVKTMEVLKKITGVERLEDDVETRHIFNPQDFGETFNAWQYNSFGGEAHILRQSALFRTQNRSRKVKNLFYVGAGARPGIGLPMCLIGAQVTFRDITRSIQSGPLSKEELL